MKKWLFSHRNGLKHNTYSNKSLFHRNLIGGIDARESAFRCSTALSFSRRAVYVKGGET